MFTRVIPAALLVAVIGWTTSGAQPPNGAGERTQKDAKPDKGSDDTKPKKADPKSEPAFELRMTDDTVMKVLLLESSLSITTKYGKLTVPANEVRRLEFGFRYSEGAEEKINKAITELGAPEFRVREEAEQALASIGQHALPALRRATRSEDAEVNRRSKAVLKLLEAKLAPDQFEMREHDTVETPEFTIKGRLDIDALKVRTKHFGDATVKVTEIRSFRSVGSASAADLTLDAAKYAKLNQSEWLETAIEVGSGQQLEVTATGKVDQWPQGPGQYMSGPEGQGGAGFVPGGGPRFGLPGQVIGRIGATGTPFVVGASYKAKATESGKLYLRIAPSPWNCDSTGSYKVIVNVTTP